MRIWGNLKIRIDPWDADYGTSVGIEGFGDEETELELNLESSTWDAIGVVDESLPPRWVFVDGVRRIDARLVGMTDASEMIYGLFGSYSVGAVILGEGRADLGPSEVGRLLVTGSGDPSGSDDPVEVMAGMVYRRASTPKADADGPLMTLQNEMRLAEARLASTLLAQDVLVVSDGPLAHKDLGAGVVGYVKRIFDPYLPRDKAHHLVGLPAAHRTPVFAIHGGQHSRYAWFLRLAAPARGHSPLAGVVRLEVDGGVGIGAAVRLANQTCARLPELASSRTFDPRAPQNLIPVGALEKHLRHLMGDARLVRRAIEGRISEEDNE